MWDFFDAPGWIIFFTALGAIFLWFKENAASTKSGQSPRNLRVFALAALIDRLNLSENVRWGIQLLIFVALGTVVALAFAKPTNAIQAASAGMGWTAAFSRHTRHR